MSFAGDLKNELCLIEPADGDSAFAECYGIAITARSFDANAVALVTESLSVAERYAALAERVCGVSLTLSSRAKSGGANLYTVSAADPDRARILSLFGYTGTEPVRRLRLDNLSREIAAMLGGLLCEPKQVRRRGDYLLYYKESENIEDFLTFIGAPMRALEIMEIKVVKDVRNQVNRRTNCETANIDKTVAASSRQVADIELIRERRGLEYLPENLRELAYLRLENPELSLSELGRALSDPISRSGVNHRLERISRIAAELRAKQG